MFFYGYAKVDGDFFCDWVDLERKFKRSATLRPVEVSLPKSLCTETLERCFNRHDVRSHRGAIFDFCDRIEGDHGIPLNL